jgi:hypothetical protein
MFSHGGIRGWQKAEVNPELAQDTSARTAGVTSVDGSLTRPA